MQTSKLGLFLDTIRSTGAPSLIIDVDLGVKFVVGPGRRMGNILDRNAHDSRNIVLYTNTLVPHKTQLLFRENNSKIQISRLVPLLRMTGTETVPPGLSSIN